MSSTVLVIATLEAAQSGLYQQAVTAYESQPDARVEMHMLDRITEAGTALTPASYAAAHLLVPLSAAQNGSLLSLVLSALKPSSPIKITACAEVSAEALAHAKAELLIAGAVAVAVDDASNTIAATAPAAASASTSAPVSLSLGARKLAAANTNGNGTLNGSTDQTNGSAAPAADSAKARKALLWATHSADAPLVDQRTLLRPSDFISPAARKADCDVPLPTDGSNAPNKRRKKACKGCTCGLRELEEEEDKAAAAGRNVVLLDTDDMDLPNGAGLNKTTSVEKVVGADGVTRSVKKVKVDTKGATSSCGSCFLGDAFRCSSCPYLGMPAFEPGQKVEIPVSMMDDI